MTDAEIYRRVAELEQQVSALRCWQAEAVDLLVMVEPDDVWPRRESEEWMACAP